MKITRIAKISNVKPSTEKTKLKTFKITINWYGENVKCFTTATTEKAALFNAMRRLSKQLKFEFSFVKSYVLDPNKDRYKIKEVSR